MVPGRDQKHMIFYLGLRLRAPGFSGEQAHMDRAAGLSKKSPYEGCGGNTGA